MKIIPYYSRSQAGICARAFIYVQQHPYEIGNGAHTLLSEDFKTQEDFRPGLAGFCLAIRDFQKQEFLAQHCHGYKGTINLGYTLLGIENASAGKSDNGSARDPKSVAAPMLEELARRGHSLATDFDQVILAVLAKSINNPNLAYLDSRLRDEKYFDMKRIDPKETLSHRLLSFILSH